ncbi:hypothetical protein [Streptomyces sp. NPDC005799]|uniref:hypothetical protein n=1 Tax=Streptomyces sp. NPDC005799 TaxID=3154678 RepID=UPI0033D51C57
MAAEVPLALVLAIQAIHRYWGELSGRLDSSARAELVEILADTETDPGGTARDVRDLVKPFTPPDHPAREALSLSPSSVRFQSVATTPESARLLELLLTLRREMNDEEGSAGTAIRPLEADDDPPYRPDADDAWLLAEPALPAGAVDLSADEAQDLILLTDADDVERIPAFQLDPESGTPYAVVVEINRLLSADVDPWGAADWWLASNVWLNAAPARLLGTGADDALRSAAQAEIPEW